MASSFFSSTCRVLKFSMIAMLIIGWTVQQTEAQFDSPEELEKILSQMSRKNKALFIMDILLRQPVLFDKIEHILVGALPLLTSLNIRPEINQFLFPWILDEIPVLLQNELFVNVTHVLVDEVNAVNISGLNMTDEFGFMDGFLQRFDLMDAGIKSLDVLFKPIFVSRSLKPKYYKIVITKSLNLLEIFLKDYGEKILSAVIKVINNVNITDIETHRKVRSIHMDNKTFAEAFLNRLDLLDMAKSVLEKVKPIFEPSLIKMGLNPTLVPVVLSKSIDLVSGFVRNQAPQLVSEFVHTVNNVMNSTNVNTTDPNNLTQNFLPMVLPQFVSDVTSKLLSKPARKNVLDALTPVFGPSLIKMGLNKTLVPTLLSKSVDLASGFINNLASPLVTQLVHTVNKVINSSSISTLNTTTLSENFLPVVMPEFVSDLTTTLLSKPLRKNVLDTLTPILGPSLQKVGLNVKLVPAVLSSTLDLASGFLQNQAPQLIKSVVHEANKLNTSVLNSTKTMSLSQNLIPDLLPNLITQLPKLLLSKPAREYFPKTAADNALDDACYSDFMTFIDSLLNGSKWAMKLFDAAGKPPTGTVTGNLHFIGSFDECLAINNKSAEYTNVVGPLTTDTARYCRATFNIPDSLMVTVKKLIGDVDTHGVPITLSWGLCLPSSCQTKNDIEGLLHLGLLRKYDIHATTVVCSKDNNYSKDIDAIVMLIIVAVILALCILATILHVVQYQSDLEEVDEYDVVAFSTQEHAGYVNNTYVSETQEMKIIPNGKLSDQPKMNGHAIELDERSVDTKLSETRYEGIKEKITKAFSIYQNVQSVLSFEERYRSISCIHGIRFLSLAWIILGNSFLYTSISISDVPVTANLLDALDYFKQFLFQAVLSTPLAIDSFFTISGCLVTYKFLKLCEKKGKLKLSFIPGFYIKRYIRITPVYMIIMMCYTCYYHYVGDGPLYPEHIGVADQCKENWWRHILYVNNIVGTRGHLAFNQCMPWSWFLACIMQFYLITPILLLFFIWSTALGTAITSMLMVASVVATAVKEKQYGGDITSMLSDGGLYWNNVFITPWCRVSSYCVGVLLGFLLYSNKKIKINKILVLLAWFINISVMVCLIYSTFTKNREGGYKWSPIEQSVFESLSHLLWATVVAWVIYACHTGRGGIINSILSWKGFLPLSRLTFAAYLIHPVIMVASVYTKRALVYMNNMEMIYMYLGHLILSYGAALLCSVLFEVPFIQLVKVLKSKCCSSSRD